jgi:hypothetical protein
MTPTVKMAIEIYDVDDYWTYWVDGAEAKSA